MQPPRYFCSQHFRALLVGLQQWSQKKSVAVLQSYRAATLTDFSRQSLLKVWKKLFSRSLFTGFSKTMAPYTLLDDSTYQFQVLATRSECQPPLPYLKTLMDLGRSHDCEEGVNTTLFNRLENTGDALRYATYLLFDRLYLLVWNWNNYSEGEELSELLQYAQNGGRLQLMFPDLPDYVVAVFKVI